jgi:hypothetical protein
VWPTPAFGPFLILARSASVQPTQLQPVPDAPTRVNPAAICLNPHGLCLVGPGHRAAADHRFVPTPPPHHGQSIISAYITCQAHLGLISPRADLKKTTEATRSFPRLVFVMESSLNPNQNRVKAQIRDRVEFISLLPTG